MIDLLDGLLRTYLRAAILRGGVPLLVADTQLRFQPPDEDWRNLVHANVDLSLNLYLIDLRENRKLRTNARDRVTQGADVYEVPPPRRVDCHYLISAWSPTPAGPAFDPTPDEHWLLAETARLLGLHDELDPVAIYAMAGQVPPPPIADERFPITLMPVEGFPKYAEFWGTMGEKNRWKPCVYLVVTIALAEAAYLSGGIVTTINTRSFQTDAPASIDTRHHIGGQVLDAGAPPAPVAGAWIELLDAGGTLRLRLVQAGDDGRFVFADVFEGDYQIRASSAPLGAMATRAITVPEPSGEYDLHF